MATSQTRTSRSDDRARQRPRQRPPQNRRRRTKKKKKQPMIFRVLIPLLILAVLVGLGLNMKRAGMGVNHVPGWISVQLLAEDSNSRSGLKITKVRDIVIHYVGNPGTTAQQNRDYFAQPDTEVNSHFVIGLDGEIIQCIPLNERSSATNERNVDTISIEVCHPDETGQFTQASYDALVKLTAWLCDHFDLDRSRVIRHYDVTGKLCPMYYVEHENAWEQFKKDVENYP